MVLYNFSWINGTRQLNFSILQNLIRKGFAILVSLGWGLFSDFIVQLQAVLRGVNEAETEKYGSAAIAAQMRHLAQGIRELAVSRPVTVFNGNSTSSGIWINCSYAFYLVPTAAIGTMGFCYMCWKRLPASSVMFVTKLDMEKAVATVSNQLERVRESISATKRELTQKLENLNRKVEQQKETSTLIANDIDKVNLNLSQIRRDVQSIN
ncbi:hypothetical protein SO802_005432 [Lithocarpus litseifolius]|uniref:DUF1664 domain-containing protein n=1 Tax=Lithocarpus litseifolius TaxID=425828 RepID=A0AAW2DJP7_9ROSI